MLFIMLYRTLWGQSYSFFYQLHPSTGIHKLLALLFSPVQEILISESNPLAHLFNRFSLVRALLLLAQSHGARGREDKECSPRRWAPRFGYVAERPLRRALALLEQRRGAERRWAPCLRAGSGCPRARGKESGTGWFGGVFSSGCLLCLGFVVVPFYSGSLPFPWTLRFVVIGSFLQLHKQSGIFKCVLALSNMMFWGLLSGDEIPFKYKKLKKLGVLLLDTHKLCSWLCKWVSDFSSQGSVWWSSQWR